jgi:hypothetical protein
MPRWWPVGVQAPVHHREQQRPASGQRQQPVHHLRRQRRQVLYQQRAGVGLSHLVDPDRLGVVGEVARIAGGDQPETAGAAAEERRQLVAPPHVVQHQQRSAATVE